MNKENRDKLIALKQSVISDLHNIDVDSYKLGKADERLNVYIKGCINNPNAHNLYELLAVRRFFSFLDKYEFRINTNISKHFSTVNLSIFNTTTCPANA